MLRIPELYQTKAQQLSVQGLQPLVVELAVVQLNIGITHFTSIGVGRRTTTDSEYILGTLNAKIYWCQSKILFIMMRGRTFKTCPGRDGVLRHTQVGTQFYNIPGSQAKTTKRETIIVPSER